MTQKKRCTRCRERKHLVFFTSDKTREDGKHPWCRQCKTESRNPSQETTLPDRLEPWASPEKVLAWHLERYHERQSA